MTFLACSCSKLSLWAESHQDKSPSIQGPSSTRSSLVFLRQICGCVESAAAAAPLLMSRVFVSFAAPEIDEAAVMQLAEMGFPLEACRKAVYYTGNMGPEMAFNWIIAHMEEPGKMADLAGRSIAEQ